MGLFENMSEMLGGVVTRHVDSKLFDWIRAVSSFLDGSNVFMVQTNWYIDPINGSDNNDGSTAAKALKTGREFNRRTGPLPIWYAGDYHIYVLNDLLDPDSLALDGYRVKVPGAARAAKIFVHGSATQGQGRVQLFGPANVDVLVALNRTSTPQHSWEITCNAIPSTWAAAGLTSNLNNTSPRVRFTAGTAINSVGWTMLDLGAKAVKINNPNGVLTAYTGATGIPFTNKNVAANDTFVVESLTKIEKLRLSLISTDWTAAGDTLPNNSGPYVVIESLYVGEPELVITPGDRYDFIGCFANSPFSANRQGRVNWIGCAFHNVQNVVNTVLEGFYGGWCSHQIIITGRAEFGYDFMAQGVGSAGILVTGGGFANVVNPNGTAGLASFATTGAGGSGVRVERGGCLSTRDTFFKLWGDGNTGFGLDVRAGGKFLCSSSSFSGCTITGTSGDVGVNGVATSRAYDDSVPGWTAARTTSWSLLAATIAGGGFAGALNHLPTGANIGPV